uniref:hypothetical protein n=1 Tax=Xenorhabdus sp. PB61.4 TaxID=2788940 RepID=UPI001E4EE48E
MADSLSIDFKGSDVFQGSNLIIIATYIGDSTHKVLRTSNITIENNPPNANISIKPYEDTNRKINIDDTNNKMVFPFIIEIKNYEDTSAIKLTFSTNIAGATVKKVTYTQHSSVDGSIDISSLEPFVIGSTVVNDLTPAQYPNNPDKSHPKLNMVIYPRTSNNKSLPYCQIPLYVEGIQY